MSGNLVAFESSWIRKNSVLIHRNSCESRYINSKHALARNCASGPPKLDCQLGWTTRSLTTRIIDFRAFNEPRAQNGSPDFASKL